MNNPSNQISHHLELIRLLFLFEHSFPKGNFYTASAHLSRQESFYEDRKDPRVRPYLSLRQLRRTRRVRQLPHRTHHA